MNDNRKKKTGWIKIAVVVVIIAVAAYGIKMYIDSKSEQPVTQAAEPVVVVSAVEKADLSSVPSEYVGRVEAIQTVQVKPQISGEIAKVCFKEGSIVKAGQLLFQIDPAQYEATVALRKAELQQAKANLDVAEKYYKRVMAANDRAVSATDRDTAEGNVLQGRAAVEQAKASLKLAQIDLGYCRITSPITGKIGKAEYTKGNYVTPSVTELATIVQVNPVRVLYSLPDRDYLDQLEAFKAGGAVYKTKLMLSNGTTLDINGERDFENNTVDESTGTVMVRLRYDNGDGSLIPGEMVRVYTRSVKSNIVNVIPQTAVMADNDGDYVYVVGNDNIVHAIRVTLGREYGAKREAEGVEEGQRVVIAGLQSIREGVKVKISGEGTDTTTDAASEEKASDGASEEAK